MKLPKDFDFVNGGKDFPLYDKNKKNTETIFSYGERNKKEQEYSFLGKYLKNSQYINISTEENLKNM